MTKIAFVCVHNSCRSQIAEALCKALRSDFEVYSAGTETKPKIDFDAVRIMNEIYNIDMTNQYPKLLVDIPQCDIYVSMGCNVTCPFIGKEDDYNFEIEDPTGKSDEVFIRVIDDIKRKILPLKVNNSNY